MKQNIAIAGLLLALLGGIAGNTAHAFGDERGIGPNNYSGSRALRVGEAVEAEVVQVRDITIKPETSFARQGTGAAIGGTVGGLAGSNMGQGKGTTAATILGGLLGGVAGGALATQGEVEAQEVVLRRPGSDKMTVIVQAGRELAAGDLVLVVAVGDEFRVTKRKSKL